MVISILKSKIMSGLGSRLVIGLFAIILIANAGCIKRHDAVSLRESFIAPPDSAKPRLYWLWLYNRIDKQGITRDLEEFRLKGISGVNLICTGGYAGQAPLPGQFDYIHRTFGDTEIYFVINRKNQRKSIPPFPHSTYVACRKICLPHS